MPSNYEKICQDNLRRRGDEFDDIGRLIAEQLYSDKSHFVYELLQNAEDALERRIRSQPNGSFPRSVRFQLYNDKLVFRHFGAPFNEEDVKGISDILKGTKSNDNHQIGKFGIGFKSVYAFTASPEIHSDDEHFVVKRYIRPEAKAPEHGLLTAPDETVFVFPFDHENLKENQAYHLILNKLKRLGPRVLLFLRWIDEIDWSVDSVGEKGQYLKETKKDDRYESVHRVTVLGQNNDHESDERWLVFNRPIVKSDQGSEVSVEVGFRLLTTNSGEPERIVKESDTPLFVFLPTEKETRMGMILQGPFRTTSARDNILNDDDWNRQLIEEAAELVIDSVRQLKEMGCLSVSALEALPIRLEDNWYYNNQRENVLKEYYGDFYPIFERVRDVLMREDLLPANDGTYVAGINAKLGRGVPLMNLLNNNQLATLLEDDGKIKWLSSEITQDRTPELRMYLMRELEVTEVDSETFARSLTLRFLGSQDDGWFLKFYAFLSDHKALWRSSNSVVRNKPILRLQNGKHVVPFRPDGSPQAYLADEVNTETVSPTVKVNLSQNREAKAFLKELGIGELDIISEVIEEIRHKYMDMPVSVEPADNKRDLDKIDRVYSTGSEEDKARLRKVLLKASFILADQPNKGGTVYEKPDQVYFDSPELSMYFTSHSSYTCVSPEHSYCHLLKVLGVSETIRVCKRTPDFRGFVPIHESHGWHVRGRDHFDPDIKVDGIESAMRSLTLEKSRFIWNEIAIPNSDCIVGIVEKSTRRTYENSTQEKQTSELGRLLITTEWLPDSNGKIHKPSDIALDDLPVSFHRDEGLATLLGMRRSVNAELAKTMGITEDTLNLARQIEDASPEVLEQINELLKPLRSQFPERSSADPERRISRTAAEYGNASGKEYEIRDRSVRSSRGVIDPETFLRNHYTNNDDLMICQICEKEMPFKKRNGECYFEAVEALTKLYFPKEHVAQFLALCPLCSAMYKELVKREKSTMQKLFVAMRESTVPVIPIKLGEWDMSIHFVETHWLDLKVILRSVDEQAR